MQIESTLSEQTQFYQLPNLQPKQYYQQNSNSTQINFSNCVKKPDQWRTNKSNESDLSTNENIDSMNSLQTSTEIQSNGKYKDIIIKFSDLQQQQLSLFTENSIEIEQEQLSDPQTVSIYIHDIMSNLLKKEQSKYALCPTTYPQSFPINSYSYGLIIDWLRDLTLCLQLTLETFYLSISIFQRYLAKKQNVEKSQLQLIGLSCYFIACKYQEIAPPSINELLYLINNQYEDNQIFQMENEILITIEFQFLIPTAFDFINHYSSQAELNEKNKNFANYIVELSMLEIQMAKLYYPSQIALAAIFITKKLGKQEFNINLNEIQHYTEQQIKICAKDLCHIMENVKNSQFQTMRKIYSQKEFSEVAKISLVPTKRNKN